MQTTISEIKSALFFGISAKEEPIKSFISLCESIVKREVKKAIIRNPFTGYEKEELEVRCYLIIGRTVRLEDSVSVYMPIEDYVKIITKQAIKIAFDDEKKKRKKIKHQNKNNILLKYMHAAD